MPFASVLYAVKPLLAVAGVTAFGMGGYNLATTGCPLGRCDSVRAHGAITVAIPGSENSGCATGGCSEEPPALDTVLLTGAAPAERELAPADCAGAFPLSAPRCEGMDAGACQELRETECPHATAPGQVAGGQGASPDSSAGKS